MHALWSACILKIITHKHVNKLHDMRICSVLDTTHNAHKASPQQQRYYLFPFSNFLSHILSLHPDSKAS